MADLIKAIKYRWPSAQCVVQGETLVRWDGPMPKPSDAEIAQAVSDYAAGEATITLNAEALKTVSDRRFRALILAILRDKLGRNPTPAERTAFRDLLTQAYKDVG